MRLTPANSKLENIPRVLRVSHVTSANGKVRSLQSAAHQPHISEQWPILL